ncbi:MAG: ATP phosphoribosyltransferase [Alphaproteobacteria bacterium]|nr:ATP phosphoribosyltransferase [Alphaproteobacteria bacterium]
MSGAPLIIGLQSKGRLAEQTHDYLATCGLAITGGQGREYTGRMAGLGAVEVVYLQSGEIPSQLESGGLHLGITGEDLLREKTQDLDACMALLKPLGFGRADLVVATPRSWIDVRHMNDLNEVCTDFHRLHGRRLRVATKYLSLTRQFFARHGISDYRIAESLGATEGAPNSGAAEAIVDITSTGSTLSANNLKVLDDGLILRSQACLAASLTANWSDAARQSLRRILDMIQGRSRATDFKLVQFASGGSKSVARILAALEKELACPVQLDGAGGSLHCPAAALYSVMTRLREAGCKHVSVAPLEYIFEPQNLLYDDFIARLNNNWSGK